MRKALIGIVAFGFSAWVAVNIKPPPPKLETVSFSQRWIDAVEALESVKPATLSEDQLKRAYLKDKDQ